MTRPRLFFVACLAVSLAVVPGAHAANKDMVQLQTQVQQLQDAVARLQQANDERMGVLRDLVQQNIDSVNRMTVVVTGLQKNLATTQEAVTAKSDTLSGQVQSLNDSLDELKARIARMERTLSDVQGQQQSTNAMLGNLPGASGAPAGSLAAPISPSPAPAASPAATEASQPFATQPAPLVNSPRKPAAGVPSASVSKLYQQAINDYMGAKYALAGSEFSDVTTQFPDDNLAGNSYYYLGEIDMKTAKPSAAVKAYDHLLEQYPGNAKAPAAHLHKAEALAEVKQTEAAKRELRALISRFPNSPEAVQAKTRLTALDRR